MQSLTEGAEQARNRLGTTEGEEFSEEGSKARLETQYF